MWYVYILECNNSILYTGITNNLTRRFEDHRKGKGGHFTKSFGANKILYTEKFKTKNDAAKREKQLKGWTKAKKLALIQQNILLLKGL